MIKNFKLLDLRENKFWTQKTLAKKLSIPQRTYSNYETQKNAIPLDLLCKIATLYDVSVQYICGLTTESKPYGKFREFNKQNFLNNILRLREKNSLNQEKIADKLHCKSQTISKYETGTRNMPIESLILLSEVYEMQLDYILDIVIIEEK